MRTAKVVQAGRASHPQSGRDCLRILTDRPWPFGWMTEVWCDPSVPPPALGAVIQWGDHHVWLGGVRYRKLENDSDAGRGLR